MHYLGNISLFVVVLILACTYQSNLTPVTEIIHYENCSPNDEIFGEKLSSVVNYVNKIVGIDVRSGEDKASQYIRYCEAYATHLNDPFVNDNPRQFIGKSPYSRDEDLFGLISRKHYFSDQVVVKVFRNGDSLDVIPTYTWTKKNVKRCEFPLFRKTSYDHGESQQKFTLSSGYLRQIVDKINQPTAN